jgi:hypothetical protein
MTVTRFKLLLLIPIAAFTILTCARESTAGELMTARDLKFEVGRYTGTAYTSYPLLPEYWDEERTSIREELMYSTDVIFNTDVFRYYDTALFFDNKVEGLSTNRQYRYVSWEFQFGFQFKAMGLYLQHKSEHVLEEKGSRGDHFPVSDRLMLSFTFINRPRGYY